MNKETILVGAIALLAGGAAGYIIGINNGGYGHMMNGDVPAGMHMMPDGTMMGGNESKGYEEGGMMGMDHSMMMVESEREFIEGMIPHHQEAVDTAMEVVERGGSTPEIKALAEGIIIAQEKEIVEMKQWYKDWYGVDYKEESGDYQPMMRELGGLSGAALDKRFLEDMIMHHMGAIMMARSVQPYIEHQEIADLAKAIIESQSAEIQLMRDFLISL